MWTNLLLFLGVWAFLDVTLIGIWYVLTRRTAKPNLFEKGTAYEDGLDRMGPR